MEADEQLAGRAPYVAAHGKRRARRLGARLGELGFLAPVIVLVLAVVLVPAANAIYHSFTDWIPGYQSPWVGLDNYRELIQSESFRQILVNEAFYLLGLPIWVFLPLVVAVVLHDRVPGAGIFRTIYFFPSILAPALLGVLFRFILTQDGMLNTALESVGLGALTQDWLASPGLVKPTIIFILAWASMGTGVVIYAAGLSSISAELFDAAEIDGASWWQRLRYVVVPALRPIIVLWTVFQVISVFVFLFAWIFVLTKGGPGYSSMTLDYDVYQNAIELGYFGTAAAEAVAIVVIVLAILAGGWALRRLAARLARSAQQRKVAQVIAAPAVTELEDAGERRVRVPRLKASRRRWSAWRVALMSALALVFVYPFFFLVSMAIRPKEDYVENPLGMPTQVTLDHLQTAWSQANLGRGVLNSLLAAGTCVLVTVVVAALGAFWLRRHPGRLGAAVLSGVVAIWLVPVVIYIIPLFVTLSRLDLTNNLVMLGVIYAAINIPFGLYFLTAYYEEGLPTEVLEASDVDGASLLRTFWSIVLPLSPPWRWEVAELTFVWAWGDLLVAVIMLGEPSRYTVTVAAASLVGRFDFAIQTKAASAVIAMIPMLIVFLVAQRAIVRGFTTGFGK